MNRPVTRLLRRLGIAGLFLGLVLLNLDAIVIQRCTPNFPDLPEAPELVGHTPTADGGVTRLGPCWWREHRSQHLLYVEGDPVTMGYCNGTLSKGVLKKQQKALDAALGNFMPSTIMQHVLIRSLLFVYRALPEYLTESARREIYGVALARKGFYGTTMGETFGRVTYYHAIHDITQMLVDNPILACSAMAADPSATSDGHTYLGRIFDFEGGRVFDEDKIIIFYKPDYGIPFVSVIWGGMVGAVSGMNLSGLGVTLNAAGSDDFSVAGTPTTLVMRDILQHASSIDEAISLVRSRQVFVTDIFTIADGKTGEIAVVELTPARVQVRRQTGVIAATNHLLHAAFKDDGQNAWRKRDGTTGARYDRMSELVERHKGRLNPRVIQSILRDRQGAGDVELSVGHRGTIDALIATHAVIFDVTTRKFWVSSPPHTLGEFVAYDLNEIMAGEVMDHGALPADPLLSSDTPAKLAEARALLKRARREDDLTAARAARKMFPRHPSFLLTLGRLCDEEGDVACARQAYEAFLAELPPNRKNADEVRERLTQL